MVAFQDKWFVLFMNMPLFGKKNDMDKKGKEFDIRKKYDLKETIGT